MKQFLIIMLVYMTSAAGLAQCTIPNGDFEHFYEDSAGFNYAIKYWMPEEWTESVVRNVFPRATNGNGLFYKYNETDANGNALKLMRGVPGVFNAPINNGFIRFQCTEVPQKFTGRYKFSGSTLPGITDTFRVAIYFKSIADTLVIGDEHLGYLPNDAVQLIVTDSTHNFVDFELDLSSFAGETVDYVTIQLIMKTGSSHPFILGYATAVVDDLAFYYAPLGQEERWASNETIKIYPNPAQQYIAIENTSLDPIRKIELIDYQGRLVTQYQNIDSYAELSIEDLPSGLFLANIYHENGEVVVKKLIKQ